MDQERKQSAAPDESMLVDSLNVSKELRQSLEVAESARDTIWKYPTFAGKLFMGTCDFKLLHPFPQQDAADRKIGDEYIIKVIAFLKERLDPDEVDRTKTIPKEVIDGLFKMGIFAMKVPKEYNGLGFSQVNYNRVMSVIASYCGSTAVLISAHQSIGVPQPLKMFGTKAQKEKYYPKFRENWISGFALTEPDVGSDPARMQTRAEPTADGKYYIINGDKLWCTNGPVADVLVVMAQTPPVIVKGKEKKQITAFIVERSLPGIEIIQRCDFMGLKGMQNGLVRFTNVKVPAENLLWEPGKGLKLALATLNIGRLTVPAACYGMAKQCLSIVRRWGKKRVQWGAPAGEHETGAEKISFIAATTFAMEAATMLVSNWVDRGDIDIRIEAAMTKYFCSEAAWEIVDKTLQLRGGRGYETALSLKERGEEPYPVERMMRDARINTIIEGTSEIMRLFLAREVMDPHLSLSANLIRKGVSPGKRIETLAHVVTFYAKWYPLQWINPGLFNPHREFGALANHVRYIDRTSHKLARTLYHAMVVHQQKLEKRQVLLRNLMDVGTELFIMAAACSHALSIAKKNPYDKTPVMLADYFCCLSRNRISRYFNDIHAVKSGKIRKLAQAVLGGELKWLEENVVWIGPVD